MARERAERLAAGRIGRPHGLDGSFHVTRPRAGMLRLGASLFVGGREAKIVRRAGTDERPIVRVEGIDSREQVEALRGADLWCPRAQAPALGEGEWWAEDLEGCRVVDSGRAVGVVRRMFALPSCEVLEVERDGGGELLVPMVSDAVRAVDVEAGTIDVDLAFIGEQAG